MRRIALVGDYSASVLAHQAIPIALQRARDDLHVDIACDWISTREIEDAPRDFATFAGIWLVPASPYENTAGALAAIRFARETKLPFLGTCGGFQHALIEFARNVAGIPDADHTETNPTAENPVVAPLACALAGKTARLCFVAGSRLQAIYHADSASEGYQCSYGPNSAHRGALEQAGFRFTAFDDSGAIRGGELPASMHPFFIGTLFQPERAALRGETPPLAREFVRACVAP